MNIHAVIDTNVIVSAILTRNQESPTRGILEKVRNGHITPMVNAAVMEEYLDVLSYSYCCVIIVIERNVFIQNFSHFI